MMCHFYTSHDYVSVFLFYLSLFIFLKKSPSDILKWSTSTTRTGDGLIILKGLDPQKLAIPESSRGVVHSKLEPLELNSIQQQQQQQNGKWVPWKTL